MAKPICTNFIYLFFFL